MGKELTVLKLGGSLLTDKTIPYKVRKDVLASVAKEIKECFDEGLLQSMILLHGVGSFGHPPVLEHKLHKGFQGPEQLMPLSKTQEIVGEFRHMIIKQLQEAGVPVCLMYPSSMILAEKMRMTDYFLGPLKGFMNFGMVPVLGGDILIDSVMGWSVGSGDQLAVVLAKELGAKKMIFASDVPGIYESDPKVNPDASLLSKVNLNELEATLERMGKSGAEDASGAMKGKLSSLIPAKPLIEKGLEVGLLSMMEYGNLKGYLKGEDVLSTRVVVE
ncbi:MAG: isopentenyl phosphate kinase [Candidatus Hodarchaeota archaeon]